MTVPPPNADAAGPPMGMSTTGSRSTARVLVVDADLSRRLEAERMLRVAGHVAEGSASVRQALDRCHVSSYDVAIITLELGPAGDGRTLVRWFGGHSPSTKLILVGGPLSTAEQTEFRTAAPQVFAASAAVEDVVEAALACGPRRGFFGHAIEVELFDYVQMVAISGRDKLLEVQTPTGAGRIWIDHGDIVHVEYGDKRGEEAFYGLLSEDHGGFREAFYVDPPETTIRGSSMHLLMEAARQMDEGVLGHGSGTAQSLPPPDGAQAVPAMVEDETSFAELATDTHGVTKGEAQLPELEFPLDDEQESDDAAHGSPAGVAAPPTAGGAAPEPVPGAPREVATAPSGRAIPVLIIDEPRSRNLPLGPSQPPSEPSHGASGVLDDPELRESILQQFFGFEGINGAAIISSSGKVLAEDMRSNGALVTLAGFYMRGAGRIARDLGYNVFDGVIARAANGSQLLMLSMGAVTAVLSVEVGVDPERIRKDILGVDA